MKKLPLIVITGPTASGKSKLGIDLAKKFNGEIISADSMQIYKSMDIGTAKATLEEQRDIPHHMIDFLEPEETFSVAQFATEARTIIEQIHNQNKLPFLVGGTSLYIQAIVDNIQFFELESNSDLRKELLLYADMHGNAALWQKLHEIDPILAKNLHPNNKGRIIRGVEVYQTTGKKMSDWQKDSRSIPSPYNTLLLGLTYKDRNTLYNKINSRVDEMMTQGLLEETEMLYQRGCSKTAKQAIGYKELWDVVSELENITSAVERLKQSTRRYAKRQLTWMRGRSDLEWIYHDEYNTYDELLTTIEIKIHQLLKSQVSLS